MKNILMCAALILFIGGVFLFLASSSAEAISREAQIDQLTSDLETSKGSGDENQLKTKARERKELLIQEAIDNPEGFLRVAKLASKKGDFSPAVQSDLESEVQAEGDLLVVHFDGKDFTKTDYKLVARDKKVLDLHFTQDAPNLQTGSKVRIRGVGIGSHVVLAAAAGEAAASVEALSVASSLSIGVAKTAVLLVNFANDATTPLTKTDANTIVLSGSTSVNTYYQENSFNQTSLTGQVFGWFKLAQNNSSCETNYFNWSTEADNLAIASGVDLASYSRIVYIFPTPIGCTFGGLGTVGGTPGRSWIFNYHTDGRVYAHELGHNIGIHHANSLACGLKSIDAYANCVNTEYGDVLDVMGNFWYVSPSMLQFNGAHKVAVGWIPTANITTVTSAGTFKIYPLETASVNPQILKINKPDTGESYIVSYRQPVGFDIGLPIGITRGASIHVMNNAPSVQTQFIDTTPGTGDFSGFGDAALQDGKKFTDAVNSIQVTQTSHTSGFAEVQVSFSISAADTTAPTVAITSPVNGVKVTKNVKITVSATASDNVGVKKVEFRRGGSLICTDTSFPYSCSMFTNSSSGKQVTYKAKAIDAANNSSTAQVTVTTK